MIALYSRNASRVVKILYINVVAIKLLVRFATRREAF
jgi:hypothetical protein